MAQQRVKNSLMTLVSPMEFPLRLMTEAARYGAFFVIPSALVTLVVSRVNSPAARYFHDAAWEAVGPKLFNTFGLVAALATCALLFLPKQRTLSSLASGLWARTFEIGALTLGVLLGTFVHLLATAPWSLIHVLAGAIGLPLCAWITACTYFLAVGTSNCSFKSGIGSRWAALPAVSHVIGGTVLALVVTLSLILTRWS